jgi:hypothetical protein
MVDADCQPTVRGKVRAVNAHEVMVIALRGVAGGTLVAVFALIGEVVSPKAFAGLFSAAPSVAVASLTITLLFEDARTAHHDAVGMVVGGVGMAACCVIAVTAIPKIGALSGSLASWLSWGVVSTGLYWAVFIGAR